MSAASFWLAAAGEAWCRAGGLIIKTAGRIRASLVGHPMQPAIQHASEELAAASPYVAKGWECTYWIDDPGTVHVRPDDDEIEHLIRDEDCPCGARVQPIMRADGSNGWLIVHASLDGREKNE